MNNYTILHSHTMMSNAFTILDSVNSYEHYIDKAVKLGMESIAFTEHGNIMDWFHKKTYIEKCGLKYIHGVEAYITESLDAKVKDNYHVVLLAKNKDGFYELNKLISESTIRDNRFTYDDMSGEEHYYYQPRITYKDLKSTSDNIIILSACLGGVLHSAPEDLQIDFVEFMAKNKHRCFLEIQHHDVLDQKNHNNKLVKISKQYNIRLVAGTDTHALNEEYMKGRKILQISKNIHFKNEDDWDLSFKSFHELVSAYKKQNSLDEAIYMDAIENTNIIRDSIDEFEIDFEFKYPKLNDNPKKALHKAIMEGVKWRKYELTDLVKDRINYEISVYESNKAIDFILLDYEVKKWCRENDIEYGEARGSVSGSLIAYLLGVTHVDPLKYNLVFERFLHSERCTLGDIDSDYNPRDIPKIKEFLFNKHGLYCAEIITYNTIAMKGAIRDVGRALEIPLSEVSIISQNIELKEDEYRKKYPKLFKYVDMLNGVVVSIGSHPAAICVADIDLASEVGIFYTKTNPYPVTQINMKEIEKMNFLKLDVLKLDTVGIINDTCKLANIPRLRDDTLDYTDEKVWNDIHESSASIFQWESPMAYSYYKKLFSKENIDRLKEKFGKVDYLDLFSIGNAAIRPAGESYRDDLAQGIELDYGHKSLNDFLKPTFSRLIYQEQIIEFLNRFCGFTMGEADMVRRGLAKKEGTEQFLPKIESGFISIMQSEYGVCIEESTELIKSFLQVIESASNYGFSLNHSVAYSIIGFQTAYLRYYYPMEFLTTALNYAKSDEKKTSATIDYANTKGIDIRAIQFRHSKGEYMYNKEESSIYKGISSIKYMSEDVANELYDLRNNKYDTFIDSLLDIKEKTSCNSRQLTILIQLDFFTEFGKAKKLLEIVELQDFLTKNRIAIAKVEDSPFKIEQLEKYAGRKTAKTYMEVDFSSLIKEVVVSIPDEDLSIQEKADAQLENLGYIDLQLGVNAKNCYITSIDTRYTPRIQVVSLDSGKNIEFRVKKDYFALLKLKVGDLIYVHSVENRQAWKPDGEHKNGKMKFAKIEGKFNLYVDNCEKITEKELYLNRSGDDFQ